MSWTIGRLARRFGLGRSTLLYYDRLGLLRPSGRTRAGYRVYDEAAVQRLDAICRYREVGLSLAEIAELLDGAPRGRTATLLAARLESLNVEIAALREQQRAIVRLLERPEALAGARAIDKQGWVAILRDAGLDDDAMERWHAAFERAAPEAHRDFLESLGLGPREVDAIRRRARVPSDQASSAGT